jgi:hypothetical protein
MYLGMGGSIGSESDNNYSTTRPSYSETTHTPFEAVDWMDTSSGTSTYQPSVNVYAYEPSVNSDDHETSLYEDSVPGSPFTSHQDNEDETSDQNAQEHYSTGRF